MTSVSDMDEAWDLFGQRLPSVSTVRQLPLPLAWPKGTAGALTFQVGESNRHAVEHLQRFADWMTPASILLGPPGSGRSTLGQIFATGDGGEVVDGLSAADEEAVFHAWNRAQAEDGRLLVIADSLEQVQSVRLADLRTRLATAPVVEIGAPDACLVRDLVEHLLVRRGLMPAPQLGNYVAARLDRSYGAIHAAVEAIDLASLSSGTPPGIRIARKALIDAGLYVPRGDDSGLAGAD